MAAGSVGEASITIGADATGIGDDIKKKASKGLSGVGASIGRTLSAGIQSAARIGGTAVAATLATSLAKGFNRLEAIDTATAKLTGLGHSAKSIESIMNSATAAVRGTAFGLGDAASAAASFSAAGVPLDGMERSLSILASTAAVAGTGLGEMTTIFGKVAATGKLNGEVLAQLSERGVPVLSYLAEQYGVTAEEASKMVSKGKVDFETFQTVLEKNLGPAAAAIGQSFTGMLSNVGAALGRLGAKAQQPAFEALKIVFPALIAFLDQMTAAVAPLAEVLMPKFAAAANQIATFLSSITFSTTTAGAESFLAALGPLLPLLGLLAGAMGPLLSGLPVIGGLFAGITGPVGLLAGALVALFAFKPDTLLAGFDTLAATIPGMVTSLVDSLVSIIPEAVGRFAANTSTFVEGIARLILALLPAIASALPQVASAFVALIPQVISALSAMEPALTGLIIMLVATFADLAPQLLRTLLSAIPQILSGALRLFQSLITAVITVVPEVVTTLIAAIPLIVSALTSSLPQILSGALSLFLGIVNGLTSAIPVILNALVALAPELVNAVVGMLPALINGALTLFSGIIDGLTKAIPQILNAVLAVLPKLLSTLLGMLPQIVNAGISLFLGLVQSITKALPQIINSVLNILPKLVSTLLGMLPELIDTGIELFLSLVKALAKALPQIIRAVVDILPKIVSTLIGMVPTLIDAGIQVFLALVEAVPQIVPELVQALVGLLPVMLEALISLVPKLIGAGVDLIAGLVQGLFQAASSVGSALLKIAQDAIGGFLSFLGIASPSKLFASYGKFMGQGLVVGLMGTRDDVSKAITGLVGQTRALFEGLKKDREAALDQAKKLQTRLERATEDHNTKIARLETRYRNARTDKQRASIRQQINDENKKYARLEGDLRKSLTEQQRIINAANKVLKGGRRDAVWQMIRDANADLKDIAKERGTIAKDLAKRRDELAAAIDLRNTFRDSIRAGVNGLFDINALDDAGAASASDMIARLQARVDATKAFRETIRQLTELGLGDSSIKELTEGFAQTGSTAAAQAVLAGGKASIDQINSLRDELDKQGETLGKSVASSLYQAGVDAAKGLVEGLKARDKELKEQAEKIADDLVTAIKKKLGIKSPSIVLDKIGQQTIQGYIRGVGKMEQAANAAMTEVLRGDILTPPRVPGAAVSPAPVASSSRSVIIEDGAAMVKIEGTNRADVEKLADETANRTAEKVVMSL